MGARCRLVSPTANRLRKLPGGARRRPPRPGSLRSRFVRPSLVAPEKLLVAAGRARGYDWPGAAQPKSQGACRRGTISRGVPTVVLSWLARRPHCAPRTSCRPRLEALEDLTLLSTLFVTNTLDDGSVG